MSKGCRILTYSEPVSYAASGSARTVTRCTTHNIELQFGQLCWAGELEKRIAALEADDDDGKRMPVS